MAITALGGILGLVAILGIGSAFTRLLDDVPLRWRIAVSAISGAALIDLVVTLVLALGGGVLALKIVGVCSVLLAGFGLLRTGFYSLSLCPPKLDCVAARCFFLVVVTTVGLNLVIALAPSTKIDELYYHMLLPKRVIEDGGLHLYRAPLEAAVFSHMSFQAGLSVAHAAGFPEAGNIISWGLGALLVFMVAGVAADLTESNTAGWMSAAIAAVGMYPSTFHVSSGAHSLGDLATLTACLLALLPAQNAGGFSARTKLFVIALASCTAASTKISLLPLSVALTAIGLGRAAASMGWKRASAIIVTVWSVFYGPALVWTAVQCGSPFGPVTARLFHSKFFGGSTISDLQEHAPPVWFFLRELLAKVSVGMPAAIGVTVVAAWTRDWRFKALLCLVVMQAILIVWLLPIDFRFLGGLQYAALVMAAWFLWPLRPGAALQRYWWIVLALMCLPWVAIQAYYARPFVQVVSGIVSRESFLERNIAFTRDFRALDRILPPNAVMYVENSRMPSYYAPRPVVFVPEDVTGREPLYCFVVGDVMPDSRFLQKETVYENSQAISVTFRTPGRSPVRNVLKVNRCFVKTD